VLAGVVVLVAAAIVAHALYGRHSSPPLATTPIAASSGLPPVTGDVYVEYRGGRDARARVRGEVGHVIRGETAELYEQPFPYRHAAVPAGAEVLNATGRGAGYTFAVTPSLATRYYVKLFPSRTAATPVARSRTVTVYVTRDTAGRRTVCRRPLCRAAIPLHVVVPAAAMSTEISKHWYAYGAPEPATATTELQLLGPGNPGIRPLLNGFSPQISKPRRISATEFELTIRFPPGYGLGVPFRHFTACAADTETRDGIGLPGRHQCGRNVVPAGRYLG